MAKSGPKPKTLEMRFWSKVDRRGPNECWSWIGHTTRTPYKAGRITVGGRSQIAARVAFMLEHGRWPEPCCLHICDNSLCCNPAHLFEGTQADNMADMVAKGRSASEKIQGELHGQAKLNWAQVEWIRVRWEMRNLRPITQSQIARLLGVRPCTINQILNGKRWKPNDKQQETTKSRVS